MPEYCAGRCREFTFKQHLPISLLSANILPASVFDWAMLKYHLEGVLLGKKLIQTGVLSVACQIAKLWERKQTNTGQVVVGTNTKRQSIVFGLEELGIYLASLA